MATMLASSSVAAHVSCARVSRSNFTGNALRLSAPQRQVQVLRRAAVAEEAAPATFTPPKLDPSWPSPIFGGSTGGLLRKAQTEEFYVITWESPKEQIFEMPTGGAAIMRSGKNLLKLARKEQCLALLSQLKSKFKVGGQFYRIFPNGEVQYLHPKDGVNPEKVNAGRPLVNVPGRRIGENVNPVQIKFTGKAGTFDV